MKSEEIDRIVEKNVLLHPLDSALFEVREEIMLKIAEGQSALRLDENRLGLLRMVIALDGKTNAFIFALQSQGENAVLGIAVIEQLLALYESCQKLCEFLIDGYSTAPEYLKATISRDDLSTAAVALQAEREMAYKHFAENKSHRFPADRLSTFQTLIRWTMLALFGEEQCCCFMAEVNDALAIVRSHPRFA